MRIHPSISKQAAAVVTAIPLATGSAGAAPLPDSYDHSARPAAIHQVLDHAATDDLFRRGQATALVATNAGTDATHAGVDAAIANWRSRPRFGHTFDQHGAGEKMAQNLLGRARGPNGGAQGQWCDNHEAAQFLASLDLSKLGRGEAMVVTIPPGLGRIILPTGERVATDKAMVIRSATGIKTAYPMRLH